MHPALPLSGLTSALLPVLLRTSPRLRESLPPLLGQKEDPGPRAMDQAVPSRGGWERGDGLSQVLQPLLQGRAGGSAAF